MMQVEKKKKKKVKTKKISEKFQKVVCLENNVLSFLLEAREQRRQQQELRGVLKSIRDVPPIREDRQVAAVVLVRDERVMRRGAALRPGRSVRLLLLSSRLLLCAPLTAKAPNGDNYSFNFFFCFFINLL